MAPAGVPPVPESGVDTSTKKKSKRIVVIAAITALALIVVGGGVAMAGNYFGWFRGPQPSAALPAGAVGYAQFDADPSADQKLGAMSFLRDVKQVSTSGGNSDVKQMIWDALTEQYSYAFEDIDYQADIKPWVGNRIGAAVYPATGNGSTTSAVAIQVTNEDLAKTKIPQLFDGAVLLGFKDGFAVITSEGFKDDLSAKFGKSSLADDGLFSSDFRSLGDPGWAAVWGDSKRMADLVGTYSTVSTASYAAAGRFAATLRFTNDTVQLKAVGFGLDPTSIPNTSAQSDVGGLPATTAAVVSVKGGGAIFKSAWKKYLDSMKSAGYNPEDVLSQEGWRMPDDVVTLLGEQTTVAMSNDGLTDAVNGNINYYDGGVPEIGARVTSSNPTAVKSLVDRLVNNSSYSSNINQDVRGNAYIVASTSSYLDALANGGGGLGALPKFTKVVPNWQNAAMVGYLDLAPLSSKLTQGSAEYSQFLGSLQAVGITSTYNQDTTESTIILSRS